MRGNVGQGAVGAPAKHAEGPPGCARWQDSRGLPTLAARRAIRGAEHVCGRVASGRQSALGDAVGGVGNVERAQLSAFAHMVEPTDGRNVAPVLVLAVRCGWRAVTGSCRLLSPLTDDPSAFQEGSIPPAATVDRSVVVGTRAQALMGAAPIATLWVLFRHVCCARRAESMAPGAPPCASGDRNVAGPGAIVTWIRHPQPERVRPIPGRSWSR